MFSTEFLITSLVAALIPGTGALYTISTGLFRGRRASIAAAAGCTLGIIPHLLASILGLSLMLHLSAEVFQGIKWAGAAYLLYLAWMTWREGGGLSFQASGTEQRSGQIIWRAVLLNLLNPKLTLFFLAFLPHFISPRTGTDLTGSVVTEFAALSGVFMLITFLVFALYGVTASSIRRFLLDSPRALAWLRKSFAAAFAALSVDLALTRR